MKRNLDLIRQMLIDIESAQGFIPLEAFEYQGFTRNEIGYHLDLLNSHGFIDAELTKDWGSNYVRGMVKALTWEGADFLDNIRNSDVWEKTKDTIRTIVGTCAIQVIPKVAERIILDALTK